MGIWTDEFIAPSVPRLLPVAEFAAMATALVRHQVVRTPWWLVAGELSANAELPYVSVLFDIRFTDPDVGATVHSDLEWASEEDFDTPPPWGPVRESGRILAKSHAIEDLGPALRAAPYGRQDIAVLFHGLDFDNPLVKEHYWHADHRILLSCFSLATEQQRPLSANSTADPTGPPHRPVRTFASTGYKHGDNGPCPPVEAVLGRYLGPDLRCGRTRG
ncbi:hypothetical protein [Streptomyces sp. NBC_01304]|uniref:hypothetical protein n=1 Tax=Streptomyces sp. NBC_01304 TaxID=2903818 RepID=UPI002E15D8DC|nr:hypothetical protein OG430_00320 [Streptomyces sp. NBC_01304]